MTEPTYAILEAKGIDTSMIKVCRKLRALARLDRITLDTPAHKSGLNH